jgi:hypothetical protein
MTSIDDGDRTLARCFTEEEKIERKREREKDWGRARVRQRRDFL